MSECFLTSYFLWGWNYASTSIQREKEDWVYPAVSFVAELGGSLGLFVGFSFLTVWDCMDYMMTRSKSIKDYFIYASLLQFCPPAPRAAGAQQLHIRYIIIHLDAISTMYILVYSHGSWLLWLLLIFMLWPG